MDWQGIIVAVTPLVLAGVKWLAPKIPKSVIPILAPILGAGVDILGHYTGAWTGNVVLGAALGMAGVGLREVVDQLKKIGTSNG